MCDYSYEEAMQRAITARLKELETLLFAAKEYRPEVSFICGDSARHLPSRVLTKEDIEAIFRIADR